jgi:nucleotide-binding universal stress UspA family protein
MYDTILIPLDGSPRAEMILPHVETIAKCFNSRVILLNVLEPVHILTSAAPVDFIEASVEADQSQDARIYLRGVEPPGLGTGRFSYRRKPPVRTIIQVAERENVDLIAMASHGLSGLARVFYGSVAAGVLHRIDRPLLIVRADG